MNENSNYIDNINILKSTSRKTHVNYHKILESFLKMLEYLHDRTKSLFCT